MVWAAFGNVQVVGVLKAAMMADRNGGRFGRPPRGRCGWSRTFTEAHVADVVVRLDGPVLADQAAQVRRGGVGVGRAGALAAVGAVSRGLCRRRILYETPSITCIAAGNLLILANWAVMSDNDVNRVPPVRKVRAVGREWLMVLDDVVTFGRGSDRDIRFAYDPVDDYVSHEAGTLTAVDDGLLVRNDSRTQSVLLIAFPGPQQQIGPGMVVGTMPHTRLRVVVPGRHGAIYTIHLDLRDQLASNGQGSSPDASPPPTPGTVPGDRLPTRSGPGALTPRERRILAALCEPLLIFAGAAAVPATYSEIAQRTDGTKAAVRNTLDNLRSRLTDRDGIPGLRHESDPGVPGSDYRAALARWALESRTITADDLRLLGPLHP
jgi:hypothetical protein